MLQCASAKFGRLSQRPTETTRKLFNSNVSVRIFNLPTCLQAKASSTFDKPLQLACRLPPKALRFMYSQSITAR